MKVSLNWLKDFVDIDIDVQSLADKLVSAGFEVEEIIDKASEMKNVVLGKIVKLTKHPDADKLQICAIDVGAKDTVQIVTGAQNVSEGDLVPVAMDNSLLPTGQVIKKGKLRGVESCGMLCSGEELKLTEAEYKGASVYGILIMNGEKYPLGTDMNVILGNDDVILDIGVTANRSDCNSVLGIAREVATVLGKPLRMPEIGFECEAGDVNDYVKVKVEDTDLCPRYMAAAVRDIKICPSAEIIQKRLRSVGLRPISNFVDITNYVLIEIGQPMHAFDADKLANSSIVARRAVNGEKIVALDNKEYTLSDTMLAICDSDKPCAIAGVMGGNNSCVDENTKDIIFESAKFARDNIRRTARTLNLHSDSSFRYERGIDLESQRLGLMRALTLVYKYGYGKIAKGVVDCCNADLTQKTLRVEASKIDDILGIIVPREKMVSILNSLQIETVLDGDTLVCKAPLFRDDIENANDLAEEIIRLYGYDNITETLMDKGKQTVGGKTEDQKIVDSVKNICVNDGYSETLTYSFTSPKSFDVLRLAEDDPARKCVTILNPLGEDVSVMRTSLAYSMMNVLASNVLKNIKAARFFEVANVYIPESLPLEKQPEEKEHLVIGAYGKDENFYTVNEVVRRIAYKYGLNVVYKRSSRPYLHSGRSAELYIGKFSIGYIGEVHPSVAASFDVKDRLYIAEIDLASIEKYRKKGYKFEEIGKYPPMERDIAVTVDENVSAAELLSCVTSAGGSMLKSARIFDIYRSDAIGAGKKSVAVNMVFRLTDRTLTDEEVSAKVERVLTKLTSQLGAVLR